MTVTQFLETFGLPVLLALFTGGGIGSFAGARVAARKTNLEELLSIIEKQRGYIADLEDRLDSLSQRVSALECENAGLRRGAGR